MFAVAHPELGSPLPGFSHVKRYWDRQRQCPAAKILPGCRFHTRCMYAAELCRKQEPKLVEKQPGHWESCHFETTKL